MAIKTLREFMVEGRKGAGTGTISEMRDEIGRLRAENLVLARRITASDACEGKTPSQVAGVVMCTAVEVDAGEIETETGMRVNAVVGVDEDNFDVFVKLSFEGVIDPEPEGVIAQPRKDILDVAADMAKATVSTPMPPLPMEPCLPVDDDDPVDDVADQPMRHMPRSPRIDSTGLID